MGSSCCSGSGEDVREGNHLEELYNADKAPNGDVPTAKEGHVIHAGLVVHRAGNIFDDYNTDGEKLGSGKFGTVCKATLNSDFSHGFAIKSISKRSGTQDKLLQEISLQKSLDHPNVAKLYETYTDYNCYYLVMELCSGGELFDRIMKCTRFTEAQASIVMEQLFKAVKYMHSKLICHRDLKPENMLLQSQEPIENNNIKVIDFGCSARITGKPMTTRAGSAFYIAPEVLELSYSQECDLWSCGVIMYIMLCGYPPFNGRTVNDILAKVKKGSYKFDPAEWHAVSKDAKDLIGSLLKFDPLERMTAVAATESLWIKERAPNASSEGLSSGIVDKLKGFRSADKFKKAALHVVAWQLDDSIVKDLRKAFQTADVNGDGTLDLKELTTAMESAGFASDKLHEIVDDIDTDGSGKIDYTEFLTATIDRKSYQKEDVIWSAFRVFDRNSDGHISESEMETLVAHEKFIDLVGDNVVKSLLSKVDTNGDGVISFEEFLVMMRENETSA